MAFDPNDPSTWLPQAQGSYSGQPVQYNNYGGMAQGGASIAANILGGMNPYSLALQGITGLAGMISGSGAATKQKQILGYQRQIAEQQRNMFAQAAPQYQNALENYANAIGLSNSQGLGGYGNASSQVGVGGGGYGHASGVAPGGIATYNTSSAPSADNGYLMGPYAQQAYRLRSAAAEQNLQHQTQNQDQNLMYQAKQMGLNSGATAAALAREHQNALQQYGDFQRNLAINAGQQEQQNLQNYVGLLNNSLGMGGQAANIYGQQAANYGNQAAQGFGSAGQIAGNIAQYYQLAPYLQSMQQQMGAGYGGYNPYAVSLMGNNGQGAFGY